MEKSLASLKPLLDMGDSELIIIDAEENEIEEEWQKEFEKIWKDSSNVLIFMERWGLWDISGCGI